jgi:hypothetical protein
MAMSKIVKCRLGCGLDVVLIQKGFKTVAIDFLSWGGKETEYIPEIHTIHKKTCKNRDRKPEPMDVAKLWEHDGVSRHSPLSSEERYGGY